MPILNRLGGMALLVLLGGGAAGCQTPDAPTAETAAVKPTPPVLTHSLEFYTSRILVYIDGVPADSQAFANLKRSEIAAVRHLNPAQAVAKYGEVARGKGVLEYVLTPEARSRRDRG